MRNLRSVKHSIIGFGEESAPLTATTWDPSDDSLICAFGPDDTNPLVALKRFGKDAQSPNEAVAIASWDAPSPNPELAVDQILELHCFSDTKTIVLILEGGDIVVVREDPQEGEELIEIVGSVDAGIAAASWSPDEEIVLIATKADTILFMTRDFTSTANATLSPQDVSVSDHVSVGWGKSETQFKGRGAKALRDPTVPEHVDEGTLSAFDDGKITLSWRGDGQYVAVNSIIDLEPKRRILRIFSREGVLESVSEAVNGLESALSWKPSGQTLAGVQRCHDKINVVLFERNGLRHGEFGLRLNACELDSIGKSVRLNWNADSTVLAISLSDRVQLWTSSNYHWYLKQEVFLSPQRDSKQAVAWHAEKSLYLSCADRRQICFLEYTLEYTRGSVFPPNDLGLVAAIDGKKIKITPLRTANIPPPMALDEVEIADNAIDVAFNRSGNVCAVLQRERISIYECNYAAKPPKRAVILQVADIAGKSPIAINPRRIVSHHRGGFIVLAATSNSKESSTILYNVSDNRLEFTRLQTTVVSMFPRSDYEDVCYYFQNQGVGQAGDFLPVDEEKGSGPYLRAKCAQVEVWHSEDCDIVVGLTASGVLHVQSRTQELRIPGCTSFLMAPSHLILTTSQHLLKFAHLHAGQVDMPPDEPETDERCRNVERGAKLVTVMPSVYAVVLQMPRGNLETIYPRALVLAGIRRSLLDRDYKKAFLTCRSHRVDMNILHDYAPGQFMLDVELFVKQVKKTEYIDLFLSSLSEDNVAETMYKETLRASATAEGADPSPLADDNTRRRSKVNAICDAFLVVLERQVSVHLQSIITAHVCKSPPDLEAGLMLVSQLRKQADEEQVEQAIEHICFLSDVNQLYDTALGEYELEVALLVAQQSQKDPREYLPYLQGLRDMEPGRQRFTIDNDLKRYPKALLHLHALDAFDELMTYMERHELHPQAIELYRRDNVRLHRLMRLYADFLTSRNKHGDAGVAYEYVRDYDAAYEAYQSANLWRESLAAAAMAQIPEQDLQYLAQTLADGLEEAKDFASAAVIHLDYLSDLNSALRLHSKAYHFAEAMRLATLHRRPQLLSKIIDPGLIECSASMTELLAEMKTQLNAQVPRLRELRQKKVQEPMAFLDGGEGEDGDVPDNLSVAPTDASTSGGTFMTRYTNRSTGTLATNATRKTAKNRRREERNRARGKKGTVYEEEYLVNSIARLIERLNVVSEDVTKLVEGLMRRTMRERAVAVQAAMVDVEKVCRECIDEVFEVQTDEKLANAGKRDDGIDGRRPWGGQGVLWESIAASRKGIEPPVLKRYEKLSLLGDTV